MKRIGTVLLATLWSIPAPVTAAIIVINNGLAPPNPANMIDAGNSFPSDSVSVHNVGCDDTYPCPMPWGDPTAVEIVEGGSVGGFFLEVFESSAVTLSGGSVASFIGASDSSTVTISGGSARGGLLASGSSTVTISGGSVENGLSAEGSSTVTMSGGSVFISLAGGFDALQYSTVTISGGSVDGLQAFDSSTVTLSGGSVASNLGASGSSNVTMSGGSVGGHLGADAFSTVTLSGGSVEGGLAASGLSNVTMNGGSVGGLVAANSSAVTLSGGSVASFIGASDSSTVTIIGTGFAVDGVPVGFGPIVAISGRLTGVLASGEPVDNDFCHKGGVCITNPATGLITLPEPDCIALFPVVVLSLAALRTARHRGCARCSASAAPSSATSAACAAWPSARVGRRWPRCSRSCLAIRAT